MSDGMDEEREAAMDEQSREEAYYEAIADLRKEIERIVEQVSSGVHNSQDWWDDVYRQECNGQRTPIEQIVDGVVGAVVRDWIFKGNFNG